MQLSHFTILAGALLASASPLQSGLLGGLVARGRDCLPSDCSPHYEYTNDWEYDWKSPFQLIHGATCQSTPDLPCSISAGYEYSVTNGFSVGADLGMTFDEVIGAGLSVEVTHEETTSITSQVQVSCPVNAQCGAMHQDAITIVGGTRNQYTYCTAECGGNSKGPTATDNYTATMVKTGDSGAPVSEILICICPESPFIPEGIYVCPELCSSST
ncbi:hypothetical protein BU16DRAFT_538884 [Lophium mytilinum]|uniref:Uncharacterized protein n=1 Tax=Lophium mytilinum TaxID=390894 RepID=A0A6A6QW43_9PEZI|nr:hypothetical protein BU16DRAFT_538884 [Lophium mytilinum]